MPEQYRSAARRCPQCGELMTAQLSTLAELDWCDGCGGVYVDWMDGSLRELARQSEPVSAGREVDSLRAGGQCPACLEAMQLEQQDGVESWLRCPACAGCFVPRKVWRSLREADADPRQSSEPVLTRFLDKIARFFVG